MKKNKIIELSWDDTQKLITLAQEERNPFEIIKKDLGIEEKQVLEIMKKKLSADKFEIWKKKANSEKPKPKQIKIDDFDDDLDGKYYIKNKFD